MIPAIVIPTWYVYVGLALVTTKLAARGLMMWETRRTLQQSQKGG